MDPRKPFFHIISIYTFSISSNINSLVLNINVHVLNLRTSQNMSLASKNSSHRRNDSGELVVFDAARYFSAADENHPGHHNSSAVFPHSSVRDGGGRAAARMSLDMPAINSHDLPTIQKQYLMREKKKYKQPSSPRGRLVSFLNSLFKPTNSKKKKKSKANNDEDHDRTVDRRRSSISHFRITTDCDSNSAFLPSVTPPPYAETPTKLSYKDFKRFSDGQKAVALPKDGGNVAVKNGSFRNPKFKEFGDVDDGEDSDSSSDLFDLPNLDLYCSGLPVYGSTNMDRFRIGAPISSSATL